MQKKTLLILAISIAIFAPQSSSWFPKVLVPPAFADLNQVKIISPVDAMKNANQHNRRGVNYFREQDYFAALKEFKIAIAINPNSQSTAVYYNNLGKVYLIFGKIQREKNLTRADADFSEMAKTCFERAIMQDCMKFEYYKNLVESYELLGITAQRKDFLMKNLNINPFNAIVVTMIFEKQGKYAPAIMLLDNFVSKNPGLIITNDVKKFLNTLTQYEDKFEYLGKPPEITL